MFLNLLITDGPSLVGDEGRPVCGCVVCDTILIVLVAMTTFHSHQDPLQTVHKAIVQL